jgi:hypothetical protein
MPMELRLVTDRLLLRSTTKTFYCSFLLDSPMILDKDSAKHISHAI